MEDINLSPDNSVLGVTPASAAPYRKPNVPKTAKACNGSETPGHLSPAQFSYPVS
jgi:hypothetical protein